MSAPHGEGLSKQKKQHAYTDFLSLENLLHCIANFMCFPAVQNFWKSVKTWQSYSELKVGTFLRHSVDSSDESVRVVVTCAGATSLNNETQCSCFFSSIFSRTATTIIIRCIYDRIFPFLPERDYVTFGSLLSQFRLSVVCLCLSVTLVHPTQGLNLSAIFSPLCTLAILWPPCKILRRSSQGNPSAGSVKHKRGIKIERFRTYRRLYLIKGTR